MKILYLILNIAAFILVILFIIELIKTYAKSKVDPTLKKPLFKTIIFLFAIVIIPMVLMRMFVSEPPLKTIKQRIEFDKKHKDYLSLNDDLCDTLTIKSKNLKLHFQFVNTVTQYLESNDESTIEAKSFKNSLQSSRIKMLYENYIHDHDSVYRDIGYLFLSYHYIDLMDYPKAFSLLDSVHNHTSYYNYALGKYFSRDEELMDFHKADSLLNLAVSDSIPVKEAYNELGRINYYFSKDVKLAKLVNNPKAFEHLNTFYKRIVFMRTMAFDSYWKIIFLDEIKGISQWGFLASFLILLIWLFYLRKIDIYEPEKWVNVILVAIMSMCTVFFVYPLHDILWDIVRYYPSKNPIEGFVHMVVSIGMVEEFVKIIPVLIILRFKKVINEPFDYILYSAVSAIGFAFIENLGYIQESSLYNINARGLMACVAHIVFSSTVGYGLMYIKFNEYRAYKDRIFIFLFFFILASVMHGFYDFWLIHEWGRNYEWLTILFFILSIHVWHIYANNTMNISTFYKPETIIENNRLKYYLILSLIGLFMFSYVVNGLVMGMKYGTDHLLFSIIAYGYLILYLTFSLSRFVIIRGYLAPISIPIIFLIPKIKRTSDYSGMPIKVSGSNKLRFINKFEDLRSQLPSTATLHSRIVIDNNLESYVARLETPISVEGYLSDLVVIIPKSKYKKLNDSGSILVHFMLIPSHETLNRHPMKKEDFEFVGWVISKRIDG